MSDDSEHTLLKADDSRELTTYHGKFYNRKLFTGYGYSFYCFAIPIKGLKMINTRKKVHEVAKY